MGAARGRAAWLIGATLALVAAAWWSMDEAAAPRGSGRPAPAAEVTSAPAWPAPAVPSEPPAPLATTASDAPADAAAVVAAGAAPRLLLRVRHASGEPAARALVLLARDEQVLARADTDAQGLAVLDEVDGPVDVVIGGALWQPYVHRLPDGRGEHELVLPGGAVIEGRVLVNGNVPDRPVMLGLSPDAAIPRWLHGPLHRSLPGGLPISGPNTLITAADGRFAFAGLPGGWEGHIMSSLALPFGKRWNYGHPVRAPARGLVLDLLRLPAFTGRFVDEQGEPVAFAVYDFELKEGGGSITWRGLRADAEGRWQVPMREEDVTFLTVDARDPEGTRTGFAQAGPVDGLSDHDLGDIVLRARRDVTLRVVQSDGTPVQGARAVPLGPAVGRALSPPTDAQGRCTFALAHDVLELDVLAARHATSRVRLPQPLPAELTVVLQSCACLTLLVTTAAGGAPPEDLVVRVSAYEQLFEEADGNAFQPSELRWEVAPLPKPLRSPTHSGGGVRLGGSHSPWVHHETGVRQPGWFELSLREGPIVLPCLVPGLPFTVELLDPYGHAVVRHDESLQPGEQRDIELPADALASDWPVLVRDESGNALAGAEVRGRVREQWFGGLTCTTEADGTAVLPRVRAPRLHLDLEANGYERLTLADVERPRSGAVLEIVLRRETP